MSAFDLLHPGLQHHIANSLGWRELRPFQEQVIPVILRGDHVVVVAPTAGGKTESAILPALSRMLGEDWRGLSVLYLCPIRALLNNLHVRLERYAKLVGRTCEVWHGDTSLAARAKINRERPDILLTTPESLEVMLVSRKTDGQALFRDVRVVIVDELHAFAGDDRGWHLLSVLERVSRLAGRELQRVGLSATVGNPDDLLTWLTCRSGAPAQVVRPPAAANVPASVQLDFVGSIPNAAVVISRLHRGEKRLVFVDSRARAEQLGSRLRELNVKTFVTHSSLSKDQRGQAERAFASETDCVIVATSVLELGVDVGDLDRVIQIDAPSTVASFLQRMGRTGRREGTERNCLFLATHDFGLLQAAALLDLWSSGYVEPVKPPPIPYHVFIQQLLTLVLQNQEFVRSDWPSWIGRVPAFAEMQGGAADLIIDNALAQNLLGEDGGRLHLGAEAERKLGHRHFSELLSVVTSQPLFQVRYGRQEVGFVHPLSFAQKDGAPVLALGGRGWRLVHLDWNRKVAHVEPAQEAGKSRWLGSSVPQSAELCSAVRQTLSGKSTSPKWSRRATERMAELREELSDCIGGEQETVIVQRGMALEWWTFAGLAANQTLARYMEPLLGSMRADNLWLAMPTHCGVAAVAEALAVLRGTTAPPVWDLQSPAADMLKFAGLLPDSLLREVIFARLADLPRAQALLDSHIRFTHNTKVG